MTERGVYCKCCGSRKIAYAFGLTMICIGMIGYLKGFLSTEWVWRRSIAGQTKSTVVNYGIWEACNPNETCESIYNYIPEIKKAAQGVQALMTLSMIAFISSFVLEIVGLFPLMPESCKQKTITENRIIEFVLAFSAVIGLLGMVIFAGEVKNKAGREIGQEDKTDWGFGLTLAGLLSIVIGCCLMACGRPDRC